MATKTKAPFNMQTVTKYFDDCMAKLVKVIQDLQGEVEKRLEARLERIINARITEVEHRLNDRMVHMVTSTTDKEVNRLVDKAINNAAAAEFEHLTHRFVEAMPVVMTATPECRRVVEMLRHMATRGQSQATIYRQQAHLGNANYHIGIAEEWEAWVRRCDEALQPFNPKVIP